MSEKYDLVVVGGGPGGYPAAIRASQQGLRVAVVEADRLGGECTNYGCIPTKALLRPAGIMWALRSMKFIRGSVEIVFDEYMEWARGIANKISSGVEALLKGYGVDILKGRASFVDKGVLRIDGAGDIRADKVVVAVGTDPADLGLLRVDGELVHNNRTFLGIRRKPSSILIVGGGYIGVEFASMLSKLGVEVTLVEMMPSLLPGMDQDLSRACERILKSQGVRVLTSTTVKTAEKKPGEVFVELSNGEKRSFESVLVAVGRKPRTSGIGLEKVGVDLDEKGYIKIDRRTATSSPGIYAAGDAAGPPLLAHKAFLQSLVAGENAAGRSLEYEAKAIPAVVFTEPEIVYVGMGEEEARAAGYRPRSVRLPLGSVARSVIEGSEGGIAKIVYDEPSGLILGFFAAAPQASEFVSEAALAIEMGATLEDLALTVHPHPTMSEALEEIAELALGRPKHFLLRRRPGPRAVD